MSSKAALQKVVKASEVSESAVLKVLDACASMSLAEAELAISEAHDIVSTANQDLQEALQTAVEAGTSELGLNDDVDKSEEEASESEANEATEEE